ncbi:hypothetical protein ACSFA0_23625 [Variovorax sp. LT1P1]|uniref:ADP-ribosyltransferase-containing protein n=1 Tax=Variovorax sp. LT1P1 TaxID=3443730 RepID=UPI003F4902B2
MENPETLMKDSDPRHAPDGSLVSENFARWFGKSVMRDAKGRPKVFHHGTGNRAAVLEHGFSYDYMGLGSDAYGPGIYFTDAVATATGYTTRRLDESLKKIGGEDSPGVLDVFLSVSNPIITRDEDSWTERLPDLGIGAARKMILSAPGIRERDGPLAQSWWDTTTQTFEAALRQAEKAYAGPEHYTIFNDFYRHQPQAFLTALCEVTGHDGVIHHFPSGETHAVAWFPWQVKAVDLNNGLFDRGCADITDRKSTRLQAVRLASQASRATRALLAIERDLRSPIQPAP